MITQKEIYLNGNCHIFAIALHELTDLQIASFVEDRKVFVNEENKITSIAITSNNYINDDNKIKIKEGLIHAFCLLDKDGEIIFDAKGIRHVDDLNKEYLIHNNVRAKFFSSANELLQFDKSFGERDQTVELAIEEAKDYIETYLSEELESIKK